MTADRYADAVSLLRRALNYLPDGTLIHGDVRVFLWGEDDLFDECVEAGRREPVIGRLWSER